MNKPLKKNIILIGISLSFLLLFFFLFRGYFSQSATETKNLALETNIVADGSDSAKNLTLEKGRDANFSTDFFKKESFMNLKEYINKEATIQKEVVSTTDDFPPPPKWVVVDDPGAGKKLNIFWDKLESEKVEKIRIYRFEDLDGRGTMIAEIDKTENTFTDSDLLNDKKYYYLVKTVNKQGQMSKNTEKYGGTPKNIILPGKLLQLSVNQTKEAVDFLWQNPSDKDLEYVNIYKSQAASELGALAAKLKATPSQKQKWSDNDIVKYEEYYYTLLTVDTAGNISPYYTVKLGNKNIFITSEKSGGE